MSENRTEVKQKLRSPEQLAAALRQTEQSASERRAYLEDLGHDLRTPLNGIIAMADLLERAELPEPQSHYVTTIREAARRLATTAEGLVECERLHRHLGDLAHEAAGLAEALNPDEGGAETKPPEPEPDSSRAWKILVAEDNTTNQLVVRSLLERMGHSCTVVENGRLAVDAVCDASYDLILMDCMMPELDGFDATREIRQLDGPVSDIPIVALTANAMKGDRERCLEAGMSEYMAKPVRLDVLTDMLARFGPAIV